MIDNRHISRFTSLRGWVGFCLLSASVGAFGTSGWIMGKAALAQLLMGVSWHEAQRNGAVAPPWPGADQRLAAKLFVPDIGLSRYVFDSDSGAALAFGPGFAANNDSTSMVAVVSGHRDTHFAFLPILEAGMRIELEPLLTGQTRSFVVSERLVVDSRKGMLPLPTGAGLVLVTCYPFGDPVPGGPLRYVVVAAEVSTQDTATTLLL